MLDVRTIVVPDPDGHAPELALKGDTLLVRVSDGTHAGWGEASHSGDDERCAAAMHALAGALPSKPTLESIRAFGAGVAVGDRVVGTAVSALDQALHDLLARIERVPVWRLFVERPARERIPLYATLNRALVRRDRDGHVEAVERALRRGLRRLKCAPFHRVDDGGVDVRRSSDGVATVAAIRERFPEVELRVDCHERFAPEHARRAIEALDGLGLAWIEAPSPLGPHYAALRRGLATPIAAGELLYGVGPFHEIAAGGWADIVLPDIKHVGGIGPLLDVVADAADHGVAVSPHNPSGLVATLASAHAALVGEPVTSLEFALRSGGRRDPVDDLVDADGCLTVPDGPGWGLDPADAYGL